MRPMSKRRAERNLFALFLTLEQHFAGAPIRRWWQPRRDPPDIRCVTTTGATVAVELTSWLDESQTAASRRDERVRQAFQRAIGRRANRTRNIGEVWLRPRRDARPPDRASAAAFREALFSLIADTDRTWSERFRGQRPYVRRTVATVPALARHLEAIECTPADRTPHPWPVGVPWVDVPVSGAVFDERAMLPPLYRVLDAKRSKPEYWHLATDLTLVVHYDMALIHNTPVFTPWFSFQEAAVHAREHLRADAGPFRRIFLLKALHPGAAVERIFP